MVGDNLEKDVYGALDFGLDAIWFNTGKRKTPKGIISVERLPQIMNL
jgi:putative hydrolase of the HAD superfamily